MQPNNNYNNYNFNTPERTLFYDEMCKDIIPPDDKVIEMDTLVRHSQTGVTVQDNSSAIALIKDFSPIFNILKQSPIIPQLAKDLINRS